MTGARAAELAAPEPAAAPSRSVRLPRYRGLAFARSLKWLLWGVAAYALLLLVALAAEPDDALLPIFGPSVYLTPVFGLPYVLGTIHRPGRLRRLVYFLLLLPLAHMAANYVAWSHAAMRYDPADGFGSYADHLKTGALGGATGATLAFTALFLIRLCPRPRAELGTMGLAVLALAAIGALGMAQGILLALALEGAMPERGALILWFEVLHAPWQVAFAVALAWLMRPARAAPGKSRLSPHSNRR